ncbi:MAG: DsbA family protein [Alphaproteobacteria bacterium]|nr:DsbA family protein [Alphaproteobacteria bacterium]
MTDRKKSPIPYFIAALLIFLAVALGAAFMKAAEEKAANPGDISAQVAAHADKTLKEQETAEEAEQAAESAAALIDTKAALSNRILGNPNAPIKVSEHSSLTCPHCAHFHKETFKPFKEAYIDTGKAYLVFSDFPLNGPALHASMIARCLPHERYFDFVQMLFEKQSEWAFDKSYMDKLKTYAAPYGLDGDMFDACINDTNLRDGILGRMKASQTQWEIASTPSFVVNNKTTISGALSFDEFDKRVQEALADNSETESGKAPE